MKGFRLAIQTVCLGLFILSLWMAPGFPAFILPADTFVRLDPMVLIGAGIAGRTLFSFFWIVLILLGATLVLGRFFCAYLCPLGITLDGIDPILACFRGKPTRPHIPGLDRIRYLVLVFMIFAGVLGGSFVFWVSPGALATRVYGTVLVPAARLVSAMGLDLVRLTAQDAGFAGLDYTVVMVPRFTQVWSTFFIFLVLVSGNLFTPRFFCRYLCPSGAVFSLFASRPLMGRRVSDACTECGKCRDRCPMGAIDDLYRDADPKACIVCGTCEAVCPVDAVSFKGAGLSGPLGFSKPRREFMAAAAAGAGASLITLSNASGFYGGSGTMPGPKGVLRPPGALPEPLFLARCVRCGACMAACPTNGLQPLGLAAGFSGLFSPALVPGMGPCEPECRRCGSVCPTRALPMLSRPEKLAAKIGTARVRRDRCIAWEAEKPCLICDEVCPFDALEFKRAPGLSVAVPFVMEDRCWGCGFCEARCPVRPDKAILVEPSGALRLADGSFFLEAKHRGLDLSIRRKPSPQSRDSHQDPLPPDALPPGFTP